MCLSHSSMPTRTRSSVGCMSDKYVVLWSGGFDSTYMIQHLLESQPEAEVEAHYIALRNNALKTSAELTAVSAISLIFKAKFKERFWVKTPAFGDQIVAPSIAMESFSGNRLFYNNQMPLLLAALAACVSGNKTKAALGYVMHDGAISFLGEMRQIWQAYGIMMVGKWPELVFPLAQYHKLGIAANLWPELRALCTCCEVADEERLPAVKFCGKCPPCRHNLEAGLILPAVQEYEL